MSILNVNIRVAFINFDISVVTESIKQNRTLRGWLYQLCNDTLSPLYIFKV